VLIVHLSWKVSCISFRSSFDDLESPGRCIPLTFPEEHVSALGLWHFVVCTTIEYCVVCVRWSGVCCCTLRLAQTELGTVLQKVLACRNQILCYKLCIWRYFFVNMYILFP
jgi:hypothetical protein